MLLIVITFEYEGTGDKNKNLSPKEYLDVIRPYLSDIINDHKTKKLRVHSCNELIDYETYQYEEWKILLIMLIINNIKILTRPVICIQKVII